VCWHNGNGGKVIQLRRNTNGHAGRNANGTPIYTGAAHKKTNSRVYLTADAAIKASAWNIEGGTLAQVWTFPGDTYKVARFDLPDGDKEFRPIHRVDSGWRVGDPPGMLPLYREDEITGDGPIWVVEGEKCCDASWQIGLQSITSAHGAISPQNSDWSRVAALHSIINILADNDGPGEKYALAVVKIILELNPAAQVRIVRLPGLPDGGDIVDFIDARDSMDSEAIAASIVALAGAVPFMLPADVPADADADAVPMLSPTSLGELWRQFPDLREVVVGGMLRRGQVGNIISTSKSYKTYLMLGMAISMAIGRQWLDRFEMIGGKVLIIDLELQPGDIVRRTREIAAAMHAPMDLVAEKIHVQSLRGKAGTVDQIERLILSLSPRAYDLVIIDPLYKTYPENFDENSNAHMTALYRRWERLAEHLDAAMFIVHHGTKGSQSDKRTVDVGAGASAQSRSADAHIALREHEVENCVVFDARIRSFQPIDAMVLRWEYPQWQRDLGLNPDDLKTGRKSRNADKPQPMPDELAPEPWTEERFIREFASDQPQEKQTIMARADAAGLSVRKADGFIRLAMVNQRLFRWAFPKISTVYLATIQQPVTETVEVPK
jgi:hypothetical protein